MAAIPHAAPLPATPEPPGREAAARTANGAAWRPAGLRLLAPGEVRASRVLGVALVAMATLFAIDAASGDTLRLQALYVFPLALAAIHAGSLEAGVAFAVALLCQALTVIAFDGPAVSVASDLAIAAASSTLTLVLARGLRANFLAASRLASTDPLTGLNNGRAFVRGVEAEITRQRRYGGVFAIAMLDLDAFKRLNDTRGHLAGDRALERVADVLRAHSRASDTIARLGGDEFALLMPNTGAMDGARHCAEIAAQVASGLAAAGLPLTASVGYRAFDFPPESVDAALHAADVALYARKRALYARKRARAAGAG